MKKVFVFLLPLLLSTCSNDGGYKKIAPNLATRNDTLYLVMKAANFENRKDTIYHHECLGVKEDKLVLLKNLIDISSFEKHEYYYRDKNHIYYFSAIPLYFPTIYILPSKSGILTMRNGNYAITDNSVYFKSVLIKSADHKTFTVVSTDMQDHLAHDLKGHYYHNETRITEEKFRSMLRYLD